MGDQSIEKHNDNSWTDTCILAVGAQSKREKSSDDSFYIHVFHDTHMIPKKEHAYAFRLKTIPSWIPSWKPSLETNDGNNNYNFNVDHKYIVTILKYLAW